jgi:ADP-ribosylglycohydrolase
VPQELKRVLAAWQWSRKGSPGSHDPKNLDPHPLARALAAALVSKGDVERAADLAADVTRTTLQSPLVLDVARLWAATLAAALKGDAKSELLALKAAQVAFRQRAPKPQIAALLAGDWRRAEPLDGAPSLLANALDVFRATTSFESAIREAVRSGTTCAALAGSLAGAYYGGQSIPIEWRRAVPDVPRLASLASRFTA